MMRREERDRRGEIVLVKNRWDYRCVFCQKSRGVRAAVMFNYDDISRFVHHPACYRRAWEKHDGSYDHAAAKVIMTARYKTMPMTWYMGVVLV